MMSSTGCWPVHWMSRLTSAASWLSGNPQSPTHFSPDILNRALWSVAYRGLLLQYFKCVWENMKHFCSKSSRFHLLSQRISGQRGSQSVQTPQDGIVILVIFAKIFNKPLTNILKNTVENTEWASVQPFGSITGSGSKITQKTQDVPSNGRHLLKDSLDPDAPASLHTWGKKPHTG